MWGSWTSTCGGFSCSVHAMQADKEFGLAGDINLCLVNPDNRGFTFQEGRVVWMDQVALWTPGCLLHLLYLLSSSMWMCARLHLQHVALFRSETLLPLRVLLKAHYFGIFWLNVVSTRLGRCRFCLNRFVSFVVCLMFFSMPRCRLKLQGLPVALFLLCFHVYGLMFLSWCFCFVLLQVI